MALRIRRLQAPLALLASLACATRPAAASTHARAGLDPGVRQSRIDVNRLGMYVSNLGSLCWDIEQGLSGLEYPRGQDQFLWFAAGFCIGGHVAQVPRIAVAEFRTDYVPGPIEAGTWSSDTSRFRTFRASRTDTTGWAAWVQVAGPLGAPLDSMGLKPGFPGDRAVWTVFNDANPNPPSTNLPRSAPIGVEVQQLVYAFHRPGALDQAIYVRIRAIHKGTVTLDSTRAGFFVDYWGGSPQGFHAATDTTRDIAYTYWYRENVDYYGTVGPSVGLRMLRGPWDDSRTERLRLSANSIYANGTDPRSPVEFDNVLRGLRRDGSAMVDSSTLSPTPFWSSGDPVAGSGWNAQIPPHPHGIMSAGPFTFAPGDTQDVEVVFVVGQGPSNIGSLTAMRLASDTLRTLLEDDFASAPDPVPDPPAPPPPPTFSGRIRARPNPSNAITTVQFTSWSAGDRVCIELFDVTGRPVRTLLDGPQPAGDGQASWDGRDDQGARVAAGLYFARVRSAGRSGVVRVVRVD